MPELHLRQPGFTYSASGLFAKLCERIQKLKGTSNLKHLFKNELGETCFAHAKLWYSDRVNI